MHCHTTVRATVQKRAPSPQTPHKPPRLQTPQHASTQRTQDTHKLYNGTGTQGSKKRRRPSNRNTTYHDQ